MAWLLTWEIHLINWPKPLSCCSIALPLWWLGAASALCSRRSSSTMLLEIVWSHWHCPPCDYVYHVIDIAMFVNHEVLVTGEWLLNLRSFMTAGLSILLKLIELSLHNIFVILGVHICLRLLTCSLAICMHFELLIVAHIEKSLLSLFEAVGCWDFLI